MNCGFIRGKLGDEGDERDETKNLYLLVAYRTSRIRGSGLSFHKKSEEGRNERNGLIMSRHPCLGLGMA